MPAHKESPWLIRTYSGHTSAKASNQLYKTNLAKGQTGLSVAFDLPTQTGYDADHPLAKGEVGKVGVPIGHIHDMQTLFNDIPLGKMNTSMTINATAAWLLALTIAVAEEQGTDRKELQGTTQNDIIKEYLSRGTHIFPPEHSMRLMTDIIAFTVREVPKWNPINICSYHLQEAGATPIQEIAFSLANAIAVLDAVRESQKVPTALFPEVVGRISFFVNSGIRFIEEIFKMRAFVRLWDELTRTRYGVKDPKYRRLRYGVQVNSLGLTEKQPENNIIRIILETLGVTLSREARARAIQLPAWNEALGLPRPWDQQWSLRIQQILAYETDLLEYTDLFNGSQIVEERTAQFVTEASAELDKILAMGGALKGLDYMKQSLVSSNRNRLKRIETGEQKVVGVNCFTESEKSPLMGQRREEFLKVNIQAEREQIRQLERHRASRDEKKVRSALNRLMESAQGTDNIMPTSIECARAGVTTGEWAFALREVFGEYRAPTGIGGQGSDSSDSEAFHQLRLQVEAKSRKIKGRIRLLIAKPGLDGHSNGAEQIALRARDAGFEVIYQGIRLTPEQIVAAARDEGVHLLGLSILSGSHLKLVSDIMLRLKKEKMSRLPVIVGGIIPESDKRRLKRMGVKKIFTPKDYELNQILAESVALL
ncbi:MAG: protein meaA [Deltaproteobacteria bacterium]|nr:protein meaA [Deltaproteobacteria bacterium]